MNAPGMEIVKNVKPIITAEDQKHIAANNSIMTTTETAELKFPVVWHYRIIVEQSAPDTFERICQVAEEFKLDTKPIAGQSSATGKYLSYKLSATCRNREMLQDLSRALNNIQGVKFLLWSFALSSFLQFLAMSR